MLIQAEVLERIERSVSFIETNLRNDFGIEAVAASAYWSPWHYQRRFREVTGYSVSDYVRKRRLARAVVDLAEGGRSVIDVAMDYSFSYEQSFIRAFRREFGLSPGSFRKTRPDVSLTSRVHPAKEPAMNRRERVGYHLRHGRRLLGRMHRFNYEENEAGSIAIALKRSFLTRYEGRFTKGSLLHSLVIPDPNDRASAGFFLGFEESSLSGSLKSFDEYISRGHLAVSEFSFDNPPLSDLAVSDVGARYEELRRNALTAQRRELGQFQYTLMDPYAATAYACSFSVFIPVTEFV